MEKHFKRTLITTALPYANGPVHIGPLAGVYVPADIYARYLRFEGRGSVDDWWFGRAWGTHYVESEERGIHRRMWWIVTTVLSRNRSRSSVSRLISIHVLLPLRIIRWPRIFPYIV